MLLLKPTLAPRLRNQRPPNLVFCRILFTAFRAYNYIPAWLTALSRYPTDNNFVILPDEARLVKARYSRTTISLA
jgi:hypothetical protein